MQKLRWFKIRPFVILSVGFLFLVCLPLSLFSQRTTHFDSKIRLTKLRLKGLRLEIADFRALTGSYPKSLTEIREYANKDPESKLTEIQYKEFISNKGNEGKEFSVLNGEGGWFYNKNTGEVKVNLTKPLKHYFKFYFGSDMERPLSSHNI